MSTRPSFLTGLATNFPILIDLCRLPSLIIACKNRAQIQSEPLLFRC
jgi:hypothetical protein